MSEKLSIQSELFSTMREQFDTILNSIVKILEAGDEGEISIKVALDKKYIFEADDFGKEIKRQQIDASWDLTRIIKAKKYKVEGRNFEDFFLEENEDGELAINKIEQMSLFDSEGNEVIEMRR